MVPNFLSTVATRQRAVVLPDRWGAPNLTSALLVREQSVVAVCRALFEQLWNLATPLPELKTRSTVSPPSFALANQCGKLISV